MPSPTVSWSVHIVTGRRLADFRRTRADCRLHYVTNSPALSEYIFRVSRHGRFHDMPAQQWHAAIAALLNVPAQRQLTEVWLLAFPQNLPNPFETQILSILEDSHVLFTLL